MAVVAHLEIPFFSSREQRGGAAKRAWQQDEAATSHDRGYAGVKAAAAMRTGRYPDKIIRDLRWNQHSGYLFPLSRQLFLFGRCGDLKFCARPVCARILTIQSLVWRAPFLHYFRYATVKRLWLH